MPEGSKTCAARQLMEEGNVDSTHVLQGMKLFGKLMFGLLSLGIHPQHFLSSGHGKEGTDKRDEGRFKKKNLKRSQEGSSRAGQRLLFSNGRERPGGGASGIAL